MLFCLLVPVPILSSDSANAGTRVRGLLEASAIAVWLSAVKRTLGPQLVSQADTSPCVTVTRHHAIRKQCRPVAAICDYQSSKNVPERLCSFCPEVAQHTAVVSIADMR